MMLPSSTLSLSVFLRYLVAFSQAASTESTAPNVALDTATFIGATDGLTSKFLGIPYAKPPVGALRFNRPVVNDAYIGTHDAFKFGPVCPQQLIPSNLTLPPSLDLQVTFNLLGTVYDPSAPESEDCLSLNVWTPSGLQPGANLSVIVWFHGGADQIGSGAFSNGKVIVERSIQLGEPIIFISLNFRLSALGFLTGREAQAAGVGNLGYRDQRLALHWVQRYIHAFGGDPTKVVIWGQSAGAMSVAAQMLTNNGNAEGLFRGAYMQSGSLIPLGDMQGAQRYYDDFVEAAGCRGAQPSTLDCLRQVPYDTLKMAINAAPSFMSYSSAALAFGPRTDGDFLTASPRELAVSGTIANIPVVIGTCDDEGTLFALPLLNISSGEDVASYLSTYFLHNASTEAVAELLNDHYPADPTLGSPFDTGTLNEASPQFKRLAAIVGDWTFEAPRRVFLEAAKGRDIWTYVSKRQKDVAVLGSAHLTDIYYGMYAPSDMTDHLIRFTNYLDPNAPPSPPRPSLAVPLQLNSSQQATFQLETDHHWPKYDSQSKAALVYLDGPASTQVVYGFERESQVQFLEELTSSAWIP